MAGYVLYVNKNVMSSTSQLWYTRGLRKITDDDDDYDDDKIIIIIIWCTKIMSIEIPDLYVVM